MRRFIYYIGMLVFFVFVECRSVECMYVEDGFEIYIKDDSGRNLLDPNSEIYFNTDNVKIITLDKDGNKIEKKGKVKTTDNGVYCFYFWLSGDILAKTGMTETYVKWSEKEIDTIKTNRVDEQCFVGYSKAFYNGKDTGDFNGAHGITLIKKGVERPR